jgi:hypothetical protein
MRKEDPDEKDRLTIYLSGEVAQRLKLAAVSQKRAASDIVAEMLDRHLPRLEARGATRGPKIPYT